MNIHITISNIKFLSSMTDGNPMHGAMYIFGCLITSIAFLRGNDCFTSHRSALEVQFAAVPVSPMCSDI